MTARSGSAKVVEGSEQLPAAAVWATAKAIGASEMRVLWRDRTAIVFIFLLPAVLASILGPAVSGLSGEGASGQAALGFAVMFSFMVVTYAGHAFFREYWYGTWTRLALVRPSRVGYCIGKVGPSAILSVVQLALFGLIALVFLDLPLHGNVVQLLVVAVALVTSGAAIGFVLFAATKSTASLANAAYLILVAFGAVGGTIVVFSQLPRWSQILGYATPQFWAMRAVREITFGDGSWPVVGESIAVLAAMTLALAFLGGRLFDYRAEKNGTI